MLPVAIKKTEEEDSNITDITAEANSTETTETETDSGSNLGLDPCWNIHPTICPGYP